MENRTASIDEAFINNSIVEILIVKKVSFVGRVMDFLVCITA
jgi:hypothetical protein